MTYPSPGDALIILPASSERPEGVRVLPAPGSAGGFVLQTRHPADSAWVVQCAHADAQAAELHAITYHQDDVHPLIGKQIEASLKEAARLHQPELYCSVRSPDGAPAASAFEDGWAPAAEMRALLENHEAAGGPVDVEVTIHHGGIVVDVMAVPARGDEVGSDQPEVIGSRAIEWADLVTSI